LNWLYPNGIISYQETILCSNNESIDKWNAIVQRMNTSTEYKVMWRDSFEEVDDPNGHLKKMLTKAVLNKFRKNGVPNHELILKTGDICLVTRAINGLGLANNSRVQVKQYNLASIFHESESLQGTFKYISPQDGAAVENNDCDVDASCGIQQWELDSAAATKQQIYSDENRNAIP
jgi:hypothetical protein